MFSQAEAPGRHTLSISGDKAANEMNSQHFVALFGFIRQQSPDARINAHALFWGAARFRRQPSAQKTDTKAATDAVLPA